MIEVEVRLTPRDMHRMRWNVSSRRWQPWLVGLTILVLVGATVRHQWEAPAIAVGAIVVILAANELAVRRAFRSSALLRGTQRWRIDEATLGYETIRDDGERVAEGRLEWRALDRVIDARDAFLLFTSARACMVLPKRCFASEADVEQLRVLVETRGLLRS